jgi:hypothetical protein
VQVVDLSGAKPVSVCNETYLMSAEDVMHLLHKYLPRMLRKSRKGPDTVAQKAQAETSIKRTRQKEKGKLVTLEALDRMIEESRPKPAG